MMSPKSSKKRRLAQYSPCRLNPAVTPLTYAQEGGKSMVPRKEVMKSFSPTGAIFGRISRSGPWKRYHHLMVLRLARAE
jgi:hypothetical protein